MDLTTGARPPTTTTAQAGISITPSPPPPHRPHPQLAASQPKESDSYLSPKQQQLRPTFRPTERDQSPAVYPADSRWLISRPRYHTPAYTPQLSARHLLPQYPCPGSTAEGQCSSAADVLWSLLWSTIEDKGVGLLRGKIVGYRTGQGSKESPSLLSLFWAQIVIVGLKDLGSASGALTLLSERTLFLGC